MSDLRQERWALRGYQIRADNGLGAHVATYQRDKIEGELMAAAPTLLRLLANAAGIACHRDCGETHRHECNEAAELLLAFGFEDHR